MEGGRKEVVGECGGGKSHLIVDIHWSICKWLERKFTQHYYYYYIYIIGMDFEALSFPFIMWIWEKFNHNMNEWVSFKFS